MRSRLARLLMIAGLAMLLAMPAWAVGPFTLRESGAIICGSGKLRTTIVAYGDHQHEHNGHKATFDFMGGEHMTKIVSIGATTWNWKLYNQTGYMYDIGKSGATCAV